MTRLQELAAQVLGYRDDEWGSADQVATETEFVTELERVLPPKLFDRWEAYALKATTPERVDYGLKLAALTPAQTIGDLVDDSVHAYFARTFDRTLAIPENQGVGLDTPCGRDCRRAIDAAMALVEHVRRALGENSNVEQALVDTAALVVEVYING